MKRIVLVLSSLLFTFSMNAQIEQYIKLYSDTSKVYAKWESLIKLSVDNIPTTGFYFEVINRLEANGVMVYTISDSRYQKGLDSTRIAAGKNILIQKDYLDSIATSRGIRLVNLLIDEEGNVRDNMDMYEIISLFSKEAHKGGIQYSENAHISLCKGGQMGLFTYPLGNYTSPESSLATLYTRMEAFTNRGFPEFNINTSWNNSPGHYKNRIRSEFNESGYSIIVVEYRGKDGVKDRLIIAYEVFSGTRNHIWRS